MNRRNFLKMLGVSGAAVTTASVPSVAFAQQKSSYQINIIGEPECEPVQVNMYPREWWGTASAEPIIQFTTTHDDSCTATSFAIPKEDIKPRMEVVIKKGSYFDNNEVVNLLNDVTVRMNEGISEIVLVEV